MRLIAGDECGLLKECIPELSQKEKDPNAPVAPRNAMPDVTKEGVCRIDPNATQTRSKGIVDMAFMDLKHSVAGDNGDETYAGLFSYAALRTNGVVEIWSGDTKHEKKKHGTYCLSHTTKNVFASMGDSPRPLGIGYLSTHKRICVGDMLGNVVILDGTNNIVGTHNAYTTSKRGSSISYTQGSVENTQLATAMAFDSVHGRIAVGGRERETTLLDVNSGQVVFKAKNLPPDPQTLLQQPVWPTAIQFLNQDATVMAVGTAYKQVRLYDVRENGQVRRPTSTTSDGQIEYRVTSLCQVSDYDLVVGDSAGFIYSFDIRRLGRDPKGPANKDMARYVGPSGSVRQLKKHPTLPRLAAVGLDRMLRIYNTNNRKQLHCIYLKQRLNCVLYHEDDSWGATSGRSSNDDGEGSSDLIDIDDVDIDQEDMVEDYVDSDDEVDEQFDDEGGDSSTSSNSNQPHDEDQDESEASDADIFDDENGSIDDKDEDNDSEDDDDDDNDGSSEGEDAEDDSHAREKEQEPKKLPKEDVQEDDDEEVVIIKPSKRRRR
jgi:ribosome biogenesis protein NSA1